ncbi:MAG: hypothetical protein HZB26_23805 [Candidatus Hydrogenedentes bacterium]|nr:hypothetical protein [Candidatus Hydrogenedentota bacterium]
MSHKMSHIITAVVIVLAALLADRAWSEGAPAAPPAAPSATPAPPAPPAPVPPAVTIETECVKWSVNANGQNAQFLDKASNQEYLDAKSPTYFASVKKGGKEFAPSAVTFENGRITAEFGEAGVRAILRVRIEKRYFIIDTLSVTGDPDEAVIFNVPLTLKGKVEEPFACSALALNLQTDVPSMPGPNAALHASCYRKFGFQGAKVAILACPQAQLRDVMKEVVSAADELPKSNIGGPWALDSEINRGSYVFDFGDISESTVDSWIEFVKTLGVTQIDFHTGQSLRFGDCEPDPKLYPKGRASVRAVTDKLHAAGISAGLHTYSFFIAKNTPYVTPVPDPRLAKESVAFTLGDALTPEATQVPVVETTKDISTITGFFVQNSVTIQIDNELIIYGGATKEAPFAFTNCQRGAYGTKVAPHAKGAKVYHLKECFGLFTPDADSTLLSEVAANTAQAFNECGFDMIYLDALDGEGILGGPENAWHYGSKFVFEIAKRLNKPALFEMSTFHHHLWYVRARMGAADHPTRSHKRFIDDHCAGNLAGRGMFLPMNLGWWAVQVWNEAWPAQSEPTYSDVIEYLMCKGLAHDMSLSLMGVNPTTIKDVPAYQRLAPIIRQYEELRLAKYFPESVKAQLRTPGDEFTLEKVADGKWQFRPIQYAKHKVEGIDGRTNVWTAKNKFGSQPARLRIEALMSAAAYDSPEGVVIEDFSKADAFTDRASEKGVTSNLETSTVQVKTGAASGCFSASSERPEPNGAWTRIARKFTPPLEISKQQALGVWVYGDGLGELLNVQLRSPLHTLSLGIGDHHIPIDFTGWR